METRPISRCAGCGFESKWPIPAQEEKECTRLERSKKIHRIDWIIGLILVIIGCMMLVVVTSTIL